MKKIMIGVVLFCMIGLCAGCDSHDNTVCYYSVQKAYPDYKVFILPKCKYRFIAIKGNEVVYVATLNEIDADISFEYVLQEGHE